MSIVRDDKVKLVLIGKEGKCLDEWDWGKLEDKYFIWNSIDDLSIEIRKVIEQEYKIKYEPDMCKAVIWHGPGHQSKTHCQKHGQHKIHEAIYSSYEQLARWKEDEIYSGCFNEPPLFQEEDEEA